jgi:hypothetical protein
MIVTKGIKPAANPLHDRLRHLKAKFLSVEPAEKDWKIAKILGFRKGHALVNTTGMDAEEREKANNNRPPCVVAVVKVDNNHPVTGKPYADQILRPHQFESTKATTKGGHPQMANVHVLKLAASHPEIVLFQGWKPYFSGALTL